MTDKDIIRIEGCIKGEKVLCLSCPYRDRYPDCRKYVIRDIFDVAKRQKAEIERLKSPCEMQIEVSKKLEATIKAEAVKEFAERLKDRPRKHLLLRPDSYYKQYVRVTDIDNLVKEMVGDNK